MNKNKLISYLWLMMMLVSSMTVSWKAPSPIKESKEAALTIDHKEPIAEKKLSALEFAEKQIATLYKTCQIGKTTLEYDVFKKAYIGFLNLKKKGKISPKSNIISIADFDQSSTKKRLWIIDLEKHQLLLNTWVSHGRGSGGEIATHFSNKMNSHQSSLGFYVTGEVYYGKHGRSLRLDGMDQGFNNKARERAIVIHGASYVSAPTIKSLDRLGLSYGCPAVPLALSDKIIDIVKDHTVLYIHADSPSYHSAFLDEKAAGQELLASYVEGDDTSLAGRL